MREQCSNCKYWESTGSYISDSDSDGDCRRKAPKFKFRDPYHKAIYPVTGANHWCGEYREKE